MMRISSTVLACNLLLCACGDNSHDEVVSPSVSPAGMQAIPQAKAPAPAAVTAAAVASAHCGGAGFAQEFVKRINQIRANSRMCGSAFENAVKPLHWNAKLSAAAAGHANDMATKNYFSHRDSGGRNAGERIAAHGYDWTSYGENIAAGQDTLEQVMKAWIASPGHCDILMKETVSEVGAACVKNGRAKYETYWVLEVARPS